MCELSIFLRHVVVPEEAQTASAAAANQDLRLHALWNGLSGRTAHPFFVPFQTQLIF
jgi:hypothetical protein